MFKRAYVEITNRCNLHCDFCPGTARPLREMSEAEFTCAAEKLRGHTPYLYFHVMGEPLLHPLLGRFLTIAGELGFRVCLTTNGTLLARRQAELLAAPALHKVSVSLHSFEGNGGADMAAYLRQCWDFCAQAAARGVICVLRLWNEGGAESRNEEIWRFLEERTGQSRTAWARPRRNAWKLGERLFLETDVKFDWPDLAAEEQGTEFCHALRQQIAVLCDGTVVPCCLDHEGELALGNLFAQDLPEILASPRARALYDGFSRRSPTEELCLRCGYASRF